MTNFWPTKDLDRYLDLKNRVEARMALADAAATGLDDPLNEEPPTADESVEAVQLELAFRDQQLQRMREEILDVEDTEDGLSLNDLTLDDFLADLLHYIQQNRAALEAAPMGIHAVVDRAAPASLHARRTASDAIRPGAIFCLKRTGDPSARTPNRLWPYFLVYVRDEGTVRYTFRQSGQCLALFRILAAGRPQAAAALEDAFDLKTDSGKEMEHYDKLLRLRLEKHRRHLQKRRARRFGQSARCCAHRETGRAPAGPTASAWSHGWSLWRSRTPARLCLRTMVEALNQSIGEALTALATGSPLRKGTVSLLNALGYQSDRTLKTGSVREFFEGLEADEKLTSKQLTLLESWLAVEIVFQFTGDEIEQAANRVVRRPRFRRRSDGVISVSSRPS